MPVYVNVNSTLINPQSYATPVTGSRRERGGYRVEATSSVNYQPCAIPPLPLSTPTTPECVHACALRAGGELSRMNRDSPLQPFPEARHCSARSNRAIERICSFSLPLCNKGTKQQKNKSTNPLPWYQTITYNNQSTPRFCAQTEFVARDVLRRSSGLQLEPQQSNQLKRYLWNVVPNSGAPISHDASRMCLNSHLGTRWSSCVASNYREGRAVSTADLHITHSHHTLRTFRTHSY